MTSDISLFERINAGDHDAFSLLVVHYTAQFHRLAARTLGSTNQADDVIQVFFTKLWQAPYLWDPTKSAFPTWAYRAILNACYDVFRREGRMHLLDDDSLDRVIKPYHSEEARFESAQAAELKQEQLQQAISKLKKPQRDVINLIVYCNLSYQQTGEVLGRSAKAIESLYARAKQNLAKTISRQKSPTLIATKKYCAVQRSP